MSSYYKEFQYNTRVKEEIVSIYTQNIWEKSLLASKELVHVKSNFTLSVIIPALNEEKTIGIVLNRVKQSLMNLSGGFEIIVVDDSSKDMTFDIAKSNGVKVIRNKLTHGYGSSLKLGLSQAKGNYLSFLDADNTYPPEQIPLMLKIAKDGFLVVGSRFTFSANGMSFIRKFGNLLFAFLVTILTGRKITDTGSGLRVFHRSLLKFLINLPDDMSFTPAMTVKSILSGIPYKEIPIAYDIRQGRSKLNELRDGFRFLRAVIITFLGFYS